MSKTLMLPFQSTMTISALREACVTANYTTLYPSTEMLDMTIYMLHEV